MALVSIQIVMVFVLIGFVCAGTGSLVKMLSTSASSAPVSQWRMNLVSYILLV